MIWDGEFDEETLERIQKPRSGPPPRDPQKEGEPADRGIDEGDASVSGDRGNRTGDRDSPGGKTHRGDGPHHGNR